MTNWPRIFLTPQSPLKLTEREPAIFLFSVSRGGRDHTTKMIGRSWIAGYLSAPNHHLFDVDARGQADRSSIFSARDVEAARQMESESSPRRRIQVENRLNYCKPVAPRRRPRVRSGSATCVGTKSAYVHDESTKSQVACQLCNLIRVVAASLLLLEHGLDCD